jgi:anti-anti-sigma factor
MEITTDTREGYTILSLNGRLDAEGAIALTPYIDRITSGDEIYLIVDMSSVPYISSGGIRVLHAAYKVLKRKNGQIMLTGAGEFSKKVLELSGFARIFPQFSTVDLAIQSIQGRSLQGHESTGWKIIPGIPGSPMIVRNHPVSDRKAALVSSGPWKEAHQSGLKPEDLLPLKFRGEGYAICIGAFGPSTEESFRVLGNMITAGGMIAWTSPGSSTADYVLPGNHFPSGQQGSWSTPEIPGVFSACSFVFEGDVHEVLLVEPGTGSGGEISLGDIHEFLCSRAKERGSHYNGVIAVKILAQTRYYERLVLKKAPVEANRPVNREDIWSKDNYDEWFRKSLVDLEREGTLVSFGVIYDKSAETRLDPEIISSFFPGNLPTGKQNTLSYTLGISFKSMNWEPDADIDRAIRNIESEGEVTGMCRLAGATGFTRALIGVSYIDDLRCDDGPVIEFEEPCPEWTEQYETITRQLHHGSNKVFLSRISGGFSGSLVFRAIVIDRAGRKQMPFVMKLGPWSIISDEVRGYTDCVERYILNSSTRLIQHRKAGESGGILYNFVGIGDTSGSLISLEDYYQSQSPENVEAAFDHLFHAVLNTWYGQPSRREIALYEEYRKPPMYEKSKDYALSHFGVTASDPEVDLPCNLGKSINPLYFVEHMIPLRISATCPAYYAPQHGDLNLKNVLLDQEGHMWLIDFSDTRITHNLRDIAKVETVIRTEMMVVSSDDDVSTMAGLDQRFITFHDLSEIPGMPDMDLPGDREKAFRILRKLRYYADRVTILDTNPEPYLLALLWYTLPVLWYRSVGEYGKKYAWITAARICERLQNTPGY